MRRTIILIALLMVGIPLTASDARALGTPAGTLLMNTATANYSVGPGRYSTTSNTNVVRVDEIVNNVLTWQDALPGVRVTAGQTARVLTMKLSNTGNATDTYTLAAVSTNLTGTDFTAAPSGIYIDTNGNGSYDPGVDLAYDPAGNGSSIQADDSLTIFVLGDIPSSGLSDGQKGNLQLAATSKTASGAPGTIVSGKGPGSSDVVVGFSGGRSSAIGTYVASSITVNINKTATVTDQYGGAQPLAGATIHYALTVTVSGSGTATGVVITDPIPANTTYVAGTLKLSDSLLTDAGDTDAGDVNATTPSTITVRLGNLTSASAAQKITFDVRIN